MYFLLEWEKDENKQKEARIGPLKSVWEFSGYRLVISPSVVAPATERVFSISVPPPSLKKWTQVIKATSSHQLSSSTEKAEAKGIRKMLAQTWPNPGTLIRVERDLRDEPTVGNCCNVLKKKNCYNYNSKGKCTSVAPTSPTLLCILHHCWNKCVLRRRRSKIWGQNWSWR